MVLYRIASWILAAGVGACAAPTLPTEPASNDATARLRNLLATSDEARLDRNRMTHCIAVMYGAQRSMATTSRQPMCGPNVTPRRVT